MVGRSNSRLLFRRLLGRLFRLCDKTAKHALKWLKLMSQQYIYIWPLHIGLMFKTPPCTPTLQIHSRDPLSVRHPSVVHPPSIRCPSAVRPPSIQRGSAVHLPPDRYIYISIYTYMCMNDNIPERQSTQYIPNKC